MLPLSTASGSSVRAPTAVETVVSVNGSTRSLTVRLITVVTAYPRPEARAASRPSSGRGAVPGEPEIRASPATAAVMLTSEAPEGWRRDRAASHPAMRTGARPRLMTVAIATPPQATARKYSAW